MKRIKPSSSASQVCRQGSKKTERDIEVVQFQEPCARKSKVASSGKSNDASKRSEVNSTSSNVPDVALDLKSWKRDEFLNNVVAKLIEEDHGDPKQKRLAEARRRKALGFLPEKRPKILYRRLVEIRKRQKDEESEATRKVQEENVVFDPAQSYIIQKRKERNEAKKTKKVAPLRQAMIPGVYSTKRLVEK